jgi:hypothetical protein
VTSATVRHGQSLLANETRGSAGADQLDVELVMQRPRELEQAGFVRNAEQRAADGNEIVIHGNPTMTPTGIPNQI